MTLLQESEQKQANPKTPKRVVIVAFEGISLFHLSVPVAIFRDAQANATLFNVVVCACKTGELRSADGMGLVIEHDYAALNQADIVIFPSWEVDTPPNDTLRAKIRERVQANAVVVGLCLGAYALAYSGVLAGKSATTHWRYSQDFRSRFPDVLLDCDPLYVAQDNIITSAGTAAAIDCCLFITKQLCGVSNANEVARMMVSAPLRSGGQNQFIKHIAPKPGSHGPDTRIGELISEVLSDLTQCWTLRGAAEQCAMSERSFSRHFTAQQGLSFTRWLATMRLNYSLELLETGKYGIGLVSELAGFSSEQNFRKLFKNSFGVTPQDWKRQFSGH